MNIAEGLSLTIEDFIGRSTAVLGITNTGKTNTVAVLAEELLSRGQPLTIVDIEGEYWSLKERYDILVAGRSEHAELEIGVENAAELAEVSLRRGISVILDLSDYAEEESAALLLAYFQRLWTVAFTLRRPYQIILEEAHEWIPQGTRTPLKQLLIRIALRGRKRGLGIILASQRSAKVEKDVLTQVPLRFLHQVVHPADMTVYADLIPLPPKQVRELVGGLQVGQAVVLVNHQPAVYTIRLRHTFHPGATPTLEEVVEPELRKIDAALLRELQAMLATASERAGENSGKREAQQIQQQARRIQELEELLAARDREIAELHRQLETLGRLSVAVELPGTMAISRASVQQMQVAGTSNSGAAPMMAALPAPAVRPAPIQLRESEKAAAAVEARPPLNEKKFTAYRSRFKQVAPRYRRLLQVLTEHNREMSVSELAAWLQIEETTISKDPPLELVKLHMLARRRYNDGYHYRSTLRQHLQEAFPYADIEALVQRLFA